MKVESDSLVARCTHAVVLYDPHRDKLHSFCDQPGHDPIMDAVEILRWADPGAVIVQSGYALKNLHAQYGLVIDPARVIDTLVLAKRIRPAGNSLDDWALQFGVQRQKFTGSPTWSPFVQRHAETDAVLIAMIFEHLAQVLP